MSSAFSSSKTKIRKRKNNNQEGGSRKKQKNSDLPPSERLPKHGFPSDHPFNTNEYRYCLAEPDPHIPGKINSLNIFGRFRDIYELIFYNTF